MTIKGCAVVLPGHMEEGAHLLLGGSGASLPDLFQVLYVQHISIIYLFFNFNISF